MSTPPAASSTDDGGIADRAGRLLPDIMTIETDLPCTDCGTALVERAVATRDLPVATTGSGAVTLAACPACDAQYYPDRTLTRIAARGSRNQ